MGRVTSSDMARSGALGPAPEPPEDPCAGVGDDLGWAVGMVFRALLKASNAAATDVPGGQRGYQVLAVVSAGGPGTQLALAQQLGVDRTVLTYLLDDLEQAGLIARQPDPADRRARRVVITPAGQELYRTLAARMAEVGDQVLTALTPAERESFRRSLQWVANSLAVADPPHSACGVVEDIGDEEKKIRSAGRR
jgi:DNA-binding MarR family transcriptional regulator